MLFNSLFSAINHIPSLKQHYSGIATIFALHRVAEYEADSVNNGLNVSPEFLDRFIISLKSKGYSFISINDLYEILVNKQDASDKIVFTLDDGYLDNYTTAYPIFKKHNVPFTVYITTSFPDKSAILWWYIIERLINTHTEIRLSNHQLIYCRNKSERKEAFSNIREKILNLDQNNLEEGLNNMFKYYEIDWYEDVNNLAMSWDDIINMNKDPLTTIGGHTMHHPVTSKLSDEKLYEEITLAHKIIEEHLGAPVEHFAYPYGRKKHASIREFELIKSLNLKTAVTTRKGNIFPEHNEYLSCLPRRMLSENYPYYKMIKPSKVRIATD